MIKVRILKTEAERRAAVSRDCESRAVHFVTLEKESIGFRETKAAGIPVTYVSGDVIYREVDDKREVIGHVPPRVKVEGTK